MSFFTQKNYQRTFLQHWNHSVWGRPLRQSMSFKVSWRMIVTESASLELGGLQHISFHKPSNSEFQSFSLHWGHVLDQVCQKNYHPHRRSANPVSPAERRAGIPELWHREPSSHSSESLKLQVGRTHLHWGAQKNSSLALAKVGLKVRPKDMDGPTI